MPFSSTTDRIQDRQSTQGFGSSWNYWLWILANATNTFHATVSLQLGRGSGSSVKILGWYQMMTNDRFLVKQRTVIPRQNHPLPFSARLPPHSRSRIRGRISSTLSRLFSKSPSCTILLSERRSRLRHWISCLRRLRVYWTSTSMVILNAAAMSTMHIPPDW